MLKDKSTPFNLILLAYSDPLKHLSHYCQQLFMESLGKNYTREALPLKTGLTILGARALVSNMPSCSKFRRGARMQLCK